MTWAEHASLRERTPVYVVEVDLDYIDDGSVTATNPDGSLCYRTPSTTDQGDLPIVTKTRRWMTSTTRPIPELGAIPCLGNVSIVAEEVKIGRGLGHFGQVTIDVTDFTDDDARGEDPFATDTSRDDVDLRGGSYLTKLMARNPYWTGRAIRVIEGWATGGVWHDDDQIVHQFFVRDVQGPSDGRMKITAAGPLQLINLSEAEAPRALGGVLAADISTGATSATFSDATIAGDYPASGYLRIGDEVVTFTRSGVSLTLTRAQFNTEASTHEAGDALQLCLRYEEEPIVDIIEDLLTTYGGVDPSYLDLAGWASEQASYLNLYELTGIVTQPTKVLDVVQELLEASGSILWWDDTTGLVKLRAVRPALSSVATWTDRLHLMSRPTVRREIGERVSRTDILIDLRSADLDPKDSSSYRLRVVGLEVGATAEEHGSSKVRLLATRWLASNQVSLASRAGYVVTSQLRDGRQTIVVEVAAKDASLQIGQVVTLSSRDLVDRTGAVQPTRGLIIKREAVAIGSRFRYTLERIPGGGRFIFLCDTGLPEYDDATAEERDPGWFLAPAGGADFGPDDPAYVLG